MSAALRAGIRWLRLFAGSESNYSLVRTANCPFHSTRIESAEPHSDLRLFIHNKVVDLMLRQHISAQKVVAEKVRMPAFGRELL